MISKLTVFHRGGAVLWTSGDPDVDFTDDVDQLLLDDPKSKTKNTTTSSGDDNQGQSSYLAINKLIQSVLLSERSGSDSMIYDSFTLKWTFDNNFHLIFVAIYFSFQKLLYVEDLLENIKNEFIKMFNDSLKGGISNTMQPDYSQFYKQYKRITKYYITQYKNNSNPKTFHQTKKGQDHSLFSVGGKKNDATKGGDDDDDTDGDKSTFSPRTKRKPSSGPRGFDPNRKKGKGKGDKDKNKKKNQKNGKNKKKNGKKGKIKQHWSDFDVLSIKNRQVSKKQIDEFNMCESDHSDEDANDLWQPKNAPNIESSDEDYSDDDDDDDYSDLINNQPNKTKTDNNTGIWGKFSKLIGNKPLETSDIEPVLKEFENSLSNKNVANVIAQELCESLKKELVGKQIGTFKSIKATVREALTESLERILTPSRPVNILHGIRTAQEQNRAYSIVFIGVNGVGKSTSLSKVIYYLKSRNLKVSVAACDTFRSGAVEQLKTHCRALKVRLFSQGYARDASMVAYKAIQEANNVYNDDVVLIDTAGRMQNNQPLMRSLVSLIQKNRPDLILFVGEALVGNDGVDQLMEFNKALKINNNSRVIDGIVLTKFDTVDDKVGAAISMTYKSRKPIVFIGTGQTYPDLKRMHIRSLITKLLQ